MLAKNNKMFHVKHFPYMKLSMNDLNQMLAGEEDAGKRLDKYLAEWSDLSRSRLKALIKSGNVSAGDTPVTNPSAKVKDEVEYTINLPDPNGGRAKARRYSPRCYI